MASLEDDMSYALNVEGDKRVKRTQVAGVLDRWAAAGTLRLSSVLVLPEPARTWAMEVLNDTADGKQQDFGLRDSLSWAILVGKASPQKAGARTAPVFRWKTGLRETHPAPKIVRFIPIREEYTPGTEHVLATPHASMLLPRHGYGLEEAHGIKHVHVLELGYRFRGRNHRTADAETEAAFRESQGLGPADPPAVDPAPALSSDAKRSRDRSAATAP